MIYPVSDDYDDDVAYCLMREAHERAAALLAACPEARGIHLDLADRYADRAWGGRERRSAGGEC